MKILVTYASKHGSTKAIAEHIATQLQQSGKQADSRSVEDVQDIIGYEAFIIGSAVYYGSYMKEVTEWIHHHEVILVQCPVWLFSSGPVGTGINDTGPQPRQWEEFQQTIKPRDQHIFFGLLDHHKLSFPEKIIAKAAHVPEGDFRDWQAIETWTKSIATELE